MLRSALAFRPRGRCSLHGPYRTANSAPFATPVPRAGSHIQRSSVETAATGTRGNAAFTRVHAMLLAFRGSGHAPAGRCGLFVWSRVRRDRMAQDVEHTSCDQHACDTADDAAAYSLVYAHLGLSFTFHEAVHTVRYAWSLSADLHAKLHASLSACRLPQRRRMRLNGACYRHRAGAHAHSV